LVFVQCYLLGSLWRFACKFFEVVKNKFEGVITGVCVKLIFMLLLFDFQVMCD
jgi:hypothetical protein